MTAVFKPFENAIHEQSDGREIRKKSWVSPELRCSRGPRQQGRTTWDSRCASNIVVILGYLYGSKMLRKDAANRRRKGSAANPLNSLTRNASTYTGRGEEMQ